MTMPTVNAVSQARFSEEKGLLEIVIEGNWLIEMNPPMWEACQAKLSKDTLNKVKEIKFNVDNLGSWDTALLIFLTQCKEFAESKKIHFRVDNLPKGIIKILDLAKNVAQGVDVPSSQEKSNFLETVGQVAATFVEEAKDHLSFVGEIALSLQKLFENKSMMRVKDLFFFIQQTGAQALPIVSLIAFLIGVIMAFVGSIQLKQFGADIYVANLVGLAMVREMGAVMSAIILAGRTGAAYAASIGTMKVTEEIDALKTLGVSPIDFLVMPRMIALFCMMPLLCVYADFLGMFGGYVVSMSMIENLSTSQYIHQTREALTMAHFSVGIIKSFAFGFIVAFTGCLRGMKCGSNSSAVGDAATQAVVYGITYIVIADAIFTFIFNVLDI